MKPQLPRLIYECEPVEDPPENGYRMYHSGEKRYWLDVCIGTDTWLQELHACYPITEAEYDLWCERLYA